MRNVKSSLDTLSKMDTYSLLMFVLFRLQQVPETSVLSQLVYLLDEESLVKLLKYFGGQTVTFPTVEELRLLIHTLTLYKRVDIDNQDFTSCVDEIPQSLQSAVLAQYYQVKQIMEDYSFVC